MKKKHSDNTDIIIIIITIIYLFIYLLKWLLIVTVI